MLGCPSNIAFYHHGNNEQSVEKKESLRLSKIVCILHQSNFAKAVEIKQRDPSKYKSCILLLGTFHTIMMYMNAIRKSFKDARLRDVLIQLGTIAKGLRHECTYGKHVQP